MSNADEPAMAIEFSGFGQCQPEAFLGLTKRAQFCLTMGVAETGDAELDAIITKGIRQKAAMMAMPSGMIVCFILANPTRARMAARRMIAIMETLLLR